MLPHSGKKTCRNQMKFQFGTVSVPKGCILNIFINQTKGKMYHVNSVTDCLETSWFSAQPPSLHKIIIINTENVHVQC